MSQRHPIDDLFRRRLRAHEVEPPMHVWRRVEESRRRSTAVGLATRIWWVAASMLLAVLIPASEWRRHPVQVEIRPSTAMALQLPDANTLSDRSIEQPGKSASSPREAAAGPTFLSIQTHAFSEQAMDVPAVDPTKPADALQEEHPEIIPAAETGSKANTWLGTTGEVSFLPARARFQINPTTHNRVFPDNSKCATFKDMGLRIHAELLVAPQYGFRKLEPRGTSPDLQAYAGLRSETEQPGVHYSANMRVSAATNFGLVARTGIQYNALQEKLRYVAETEQRFTIVNVLGPDGQVIRIDTIYETLHREKTIANRYEMLHVPLLMGYELPLRRWLFTLQGGALVNVLFRQRGAIFLPQGGEMPSHFATLAQEGIEVFRPCLGIGWYAAAGIAYNIQPRLQVMAEPHVQSFPQSFTALSHPVSQRYTLASVSVGLRYQL